MSVDAFTRAVNIFVNPINEIIDFCVYSRIAKIRTAISETCNSFQDIR